MIIDRYNTFSLNQAITATAPSTDVIDLSNVLSGVGPGRDVGPGTPLRVAMYVTTAAGAGAMTLTVELQGAPDNGSGAPGTYETLATSPAYTAAQLAQGVKLFPVTWPAKTRMNTLHRYLRINYTVATGPFVGLVVYSTLVLDREDTYAYPAGLVIVN